MVAVLELLKVLKSLKTSRKESRLMSKWLNESMKWNFLKFQVV